MKKYSVAALCGFVEGLFLFKCRGIFFKIAILKKRLFSVLFCGIQIQVSIALWGVWALYKLACSKTNGVFSDCAVGVKRKISQMLSENYVSDISGVLHYKSRAFKLLFD